MDEITTLLGQSPASMMGPDVNVVTALHSTGWEQATASEAILFISLTIVARLANRCL